MRPVQYTFSSSPSPSFQCASSFSSGFFSNSIWHLSTTTRLKFCTCPLMTWQSRAYISEKWDSCWALVTMISTPALISSSESQIPDCTHCLLSLLKLVIVSLFRTTRAVLMVASYSESSSSAPRTLPFHLVSSLTSRGLQSLSSGAVSPLRETSPPILPAVELAISCCTRSSSDQMTWSGALKPDVGLAVKLRRSAKRSAAL
mmetsp:Transcript_454/g.821  ORF Transcript_454/g.821 Transcript_454/m.821 type:complete len:202 (-) Transcript_454:129-734(-)